jgi:hypothetical protein
MTENIDEMAEQIIDEHEATYHPGRLCRENERGQCADRPSRSKELGDGTWSAWKAIFTLHGDDTGPIHIGVQMEDETYISGRLFSFSNLPDGEPERELVLVAPVSMRTRDGETHEVGSQFVIVASRRIVRIDVTHLKPDPDPS